MYFDEAHCSAMTFCLCCDTQLVKTIKIGFIVKPYA